MELRVRPNDKVLSVDDCRLLPHKDHKQVEKCLVQVPPDVSFLSPLYGSVSFSFII